MKTGFLVVMMGAMLTLSGCGDKAAEGNQASAPPVAAVAAPKGSIWSETVAATPEGGFRMGNPDAPLKLIEYASFTCPHCAEFAETADEGLRAKVDTGKVSFEFRNLIRDPLDLTTAVLARCGGKDPFFSLSHQLFANQAAMFKTIQGAGDAGYQAAMQAPPNQRLVKLAELAGLIDFVKARGIADAQARTCLADVAAAEKLAAESGAGAEKYQVEGTPTLILNEKKIDNANTWPLLQAALKEAGA
ncbi:DsbA family protein [Sphingobium sufflavum]|uniref:thioredoxin domain-containing protein n=1 Tax=Sphingobium sufflavum TaxID=1129547 RepID=UPI001F228D77|nr:thioredoxin domain-containing protein [Sphingobium sufflavum]MCE7795319.1 DsbA family protein [Sphingobium sufflavum]